MTDLTIAVYFSVGVVLAQWFHTLHAAAVYHQKEVRALEWLPWFSRRDPDDPGNVRLFWIPAGILPDREQTTISSFADQATLDQRATWPSQLPPIQCDLDRLPSSLRPMFRLVGLQATNLYYCFVAALLYGAITFGVVFWLPSLADVTFPTLLLYGVAFGGLHAFSFFLVGSSVALTLIEGLLAFNSVILSLLLSDVLSYNTATGLLQFSAALIVGPLVFWLHFQNDRGHIEYGNFISMYYIIVPILYAEFFVLLLGLLAI